MKDSTSNINSRQLTPDERIQINSQITAELVDEFYHQTPFTVYCSIVCSIFYLMVYFEPVGDLLILIWFSLLNLLHIGIGALNFQFKWHQSRYSLQTWFKLNAIVLIMMSAIWGSSLMIIHPEITYPYLPFLVLAVIAATCMITTLGNFKVFSICNSFILLPLVVWCMLISYPKYLNPGILTSIYFLFLLGISYRTSGYLKRVIQLKNENLHFTYQATHDLLTDLPNQRMLTQLLDDTIKKSRKNSNMFALVCISINHLEFVKASVGNREDLIVQTITKALDTQFKNKMQKDNNKNWILTQPRTHIFAVIIEPITLSTLENDIHYLSSILEQPFQFLNEDKQNSISMGISLYPKEGDNARILLTHAYEAMFKAKLQPGNHIEYFKSPLEPERKSLSLDLERDLHQAIPNNELEVYYQPIIDLKNGRIGGTEALIRWKHPKLGLISPIDFLPLAEKTGLIIDIGKWILEKSAIQTLQWHNQGFTKLSLKVAINLSMQQLKHGNLVKILDQMMDKTGISPKFLELEITEDALLDEELAPIIKELSRKGITLSLDDFGTGFSGLNYLKVYNINTIKIDKSLIQTVTTHPQSARIVSTILTMANELGIKTLAEGVETKEQLDFLQKRDCLLVQGYYFCKPLNAEKFTRLLENHLQFFENTDPLAGDSIQ